MMRWILLLLLCFGCESASHNNQSDVYITATSFAQPLVQINPTPPKVAIVNYVPLVWEENDPSVALFNLYYSDTGPHVYEHVVSCTNMACVISNMPIGATWYFAATAVDTNGVESNLSDQYAFTMSPMLDLEFVFGSPAKNVSVQSSTDLISWGEYSSRLRSNGLWRVDIDSPAQFFRGVVQLQ